MPQNMIFLHGLESNSQTYKAGVIRGHFPQLFVPDFSGPLAERMRALYPLLERKSDWTIIGSSFGGLMGAIFTCEHPDQVRKLVLMAPALMLPEFDPFVRRPPVEVPTLVIHGTRDDIVPLEEVRGIAQKVFANLAYQIVDDDHRLHKATGALDWKAILA